MRARLCKTWLIEEKVCLYFKYNGKPLKGAREGRPGSSNIVRFSSHLAAGWRYNWIKGR